MSEDWAMRLCMHVCASIVTWRKGQLKVRSSGMSMNWSWNSGRRFVLLYAMSLFRKVSPRTFCGDFDGPVRCRVVSGVLRNLRAFKWAPDC